MTQPPKGMRHCPTREDGVETLFAHAITRGACQTRQAEHYHKCFTCAHNNNRAQVQPVPPTKPHGGRELARAVSAS